MIKPQTRTITLAGAALCLMIAAGCDEQPADLATWEENFAELVEAERAFARETSMRGIRDGFLAHMASEAIVFQPGPTNAVEYYRKQEASSGVLVWEPVYADLSSAGDLGYTTGPFTYSPSPEEPPVVHGNYFSFWKKQADGSWKVVIDIGTLNPPPPSAPSGVKTPDYRTNFADHDLEEEDQSSLAELLAADRELAAVLSAATPIELSSYVTADVRLLRSGERPLSGIAAMKSLRADQPGRLNSSPIGGDVSVSGDFSYTYGEYSFVPTGPGEEEVGNYLRAWRRTADGRWKVGAEVLSRHQ